MTIAAAIPTADVTNGVCGPDINIINNNNNDNNGPAGATTSMKIVEAASVPSAGININKITNYDIRQGSSAAVIGGLARDNGMEATSNIDNLPQAIAIRKAATAATVEIADAATAARYPRDCLDSHTTVEAAAIGVRKRSNATVDANAAYLLMIMELKQLPLVIIFLRLLLFGRPQTTTRTIPISL